MSELLPCPNPECRSSDLKQYSLNMHSGPSWWVTCEACKLCGPCAANDTEALRLWNALPREEPWVKIEPGCAMPVLSGCTYNPRGDRVPFIELDLAWSTEESNGVQVAAGWTPIDRFGPQHTHWRYHVPPRHPGKG